MSSAQIRRFLRRFFIESINLKRAINIEDLSDQERLARIEQLWDQEEQLTAECAIHSVQVRIQSKRIAVRSERDTGH
ncbi:MAG: hypothetical protein NVS9B15_20290 [Acidobacteriaceae bacterium]